MVLISTLSGVSGGETAAEHKLIEKRRLVVVISDIIWVNIARFYCFQGLTSSMSWCCEKRLPRRNRSSEMSKIVVKVVKVVKVVAKIVK